MRLARTQRFGHQHHEYGALSFELETRQIEGLVTFPNEPGPRRTFTRARSFLPRQEVEVIVLESITENAAFRWASNRLKSQPWDPDFGRSHPGRQHG